MSVPLATPPAAAPGRGGPGGLKPLGSVVVVLGVVVVAVALAAYVMPKGSPPVVQSAPAGQVPLVAPAAEAAKTVTHGVVYELVGRGGARSVSYVAQGNDLMQRAEVTMPWSASFDRVGPADRQEFYSLTARNAGKGELRCRIVVDGVTVAEKAVSGEDAVLSCMA